MYAIHENAPRKGVGCNTTLRSATGESVCTCTFARERVVGLLLLLPNIPYTRHAHIRAMHSINRERRDVAFSFNRDAERCGGRGLIVCVARGVVTVYTIPLSCFSI